MVTSIEAPFTFLQEPAEIFRFNTVVFTHVTLGLAPEVLDTVDVILLVGEQL